MLNRSGSILKRTVFNLSNVTLRQPPNYYGLIKCKSTSTTPTGNSQPYNPMKTIQSDIPPENKPSNAEETLSGYLTRHEKGISLPVRPEFLRAKPWTTEELKAIDINVYHRKPKNISDYVAFGIVKFLRLFADGFFRKRYVHRAIVLETVAGVPGMVAGMFCHLKSLRRMRNDYGWIEKLLHEAENERMHLMIWMKVTQPTGFERFLVTGAQGVFFNLYAFFYLFFPKTAHRMVGYLEEEAVISYTAFAKQIEDGRIDNLQAPQLAIDYYNLHKDALLLDVVYAIRADEASHRDSNHEFADRILVQDENLSHKLKK
uniref:Alternative oxidase n=1 Tax=Panagrolaimus superbus TaxID=310955 RepID=A0A914YA45_9BILA